MQSITAMRTSGRAGPPGRAGSGSVTRPGLVLLMVSAAALTACSSGSDAPALPPAPAGTRYLNSCSQLALQAPSQATGLALTRSEDRGEAGKGRICIFTAGKRTSQELSVLFTPVTAAEHDTQVKALLSDQSPGDGQKLVSSGPLQHGDAAVYSLDHASGTGDDDGAPASYTLRVAQISGSTRITASVLNTTTQALPWQRKDAARQAALQLLSWASAYSYPSTPAATAG